MIRMPTAWIDDEARRIREVVESRSLPGFFHGYDIEFGEDWAGDPAATVWLHVDTARSTSPDEFEVIHRFIQDTGRDLVALDLVHRPYVRFQVRQKAATA